MSLLKLQEHCEINFLMFVSLDVEKMVLQE